MNDKIDTAIQATERAERNPVRMNQFQVTIASTGRPAIVALPDDATDSEIAELAGWLLTAVMTTYRQQRLGALGRLVLPPGAQLPTRVPEPRSPQPLFADPAVTP